MRRRSFLGFVLALSLCAVLAGGASAQGGRRGMFGRGGLQMLRIPEVQKELKMTPEQIGKIDAKQETVRQGVQDAFQGNNIFQMSTEDRQKAMDKVQDVQNKAVADILDPTQQKRFHQLELQLQGPNAISRKDVGDELKLTDDQKKKVLDVLRQTDTDRRAAISGVDLQSMSDEERAKMMAKMQDIQKTQGDKFQALLTADQQKQWKDMQGTPFTFPPDNPPAR
jgi:hypothetical protein